MRVISLITDFGLKDSFVGALKGVILGINPRAAIVDICHEVPAQDIIRAAFCLESSYRFFPQGAIHMAVVDPGVGTKRRKLLVQTKDYFFVGPDNGVLSLALKGEEAVKVIEITNERFFLKPVSHTFHARDIFAPVAAHLSKGGAVERFGKKTSSFRRLALPEVRKTRRGLRGEVVYIDRFGNLISNIRRDEIEPLALKNRLKLSIKNTVIDGLSSSYAQARPGRPLAIIDSSQYLEIAVQGASACRRLSAGKGAQVEVEICRR